jgi:hypothetical protein
MPCGFFWQKWAISNIVGKIDFPKKLNGKIERNYFVGH